MISFKFSITNRLKLKKRIRLKFLESCIQCIEFAIFAQAARAHGLVTHMASAAKRTKLDLLALCRAAPAPDALLDCALRCDVNKEHSWCYFPKMPANEAVIFKQFDSNPCESQVCIHAAIEMDEDGPKPLPERQSVELRAIVIF